MAGDMRGYGDSRVSGAYVEQSTQYLIRCFHHFGRGVEQLLILLQRYHIVHYIRHTGPILLRGSTSDLLGRLHHPSVRIAHTRVANLHNGVDHKA